MTMFERTPKTPRSELRSMEHEWRRKQHTVYVPQPTLTARALTGVATLIGTHPAWCFVAVCGSAYVAGIMTGAVL